MLCFPLIIPEFYFNIRVTACCYRVNGKISRLHNPNVKIVHLFHKIISACYPVTAYPASATPYAAMWPPLTELWLRVLDFVVIWIRCCCWFTHPVQKPTKLVIIYKHNRFLSRNCVKMSTYFFIY
ncbi:hypothetical protein HanIR_Chr05g0211581 [Helianthus annuus]|nr:hypothetical protein HanIR_Chr05g0211581 [Helianthus annuus]